jgi:hypothetical protein
LTPKKHNSNNHCKSHHSKDDDELSDAHHPNTTTNPPSNNNSGSSNNRASKSLAEISKRFVTHYGKDNILDYIAGNIDPLNVRGLLFMPRDTKAAERSPKPSSEFLGL